MTDFSAARINMVESQVRCNGVTNESVVAAMSAVPREFFVPASMRGIAYMDEDLQIYGGRYLLQPRTFSKLCQYAEVGPQDKVLDVGCATGYSSAVLARIAHSVVALEVNADLAARAEATLVDLGVTNVSVVTRPLQEGCRDQGPYDVILLNGSVPVAPASLFDQLAAGGRLVVVIGGRPVGQGHVFTSANGIVSGRAVFDSDVHPLPGFEIAESFVF
jgi:protein-L-isoaspartate(D-aspartate) O-methyltransferase